MNLQPLAPAEALALQRLIGRTIKRELAEPVIIADPNGLTDDQGKPLTQIELPDYIVAGCLRIEAGHKVFHQLLVALAAQLPPGAEPWAKQITFNQVVIYPCHWMGDAEWKLVNPFKAAVLHADALPAGSLN